MPNHRGEQFNFAFAASADKPQPGSQKIRRHQRHWSDAPPILEEHPPVSSDEPKRGIVLEIPRYKDGLDDEPNVPAPDMWKKRH